MTSEFFPALPVNPEIYSILTRLATKGFKKKIITTKVITFKKAQILTAGSESHSEFQQ